MFKSNIVETINEIVECLLRRREIENTTDKVVFMTLRLEVQKDNESWKGECRHLHLMFHSPNNYVLAGYQMFDHFSKIPDESNWRYLSYHDSCWRQDGTNSVLFEAYMAMCKSAFPDIAPSMLKATAELVGIRILRVSSVEFERGESIHLKF